MFYKTFQRDLVAAAVTSVLAGSVGMIQAGQIVTDAPEGEALKTAVSSTNKQFGFGGWNLDNVDVNITNLDYAPTGGTFDSSTGIYSAMYLFESFESSLKTGGEVRGKLHGKNWPVGEPSGVKVLNGDLGTKQGRPQNCIMTSSYLESGYLGSGNKPTLCSSGFQTHKRFKINMLPSMVANAGSGDGLPVDMTFNLVAGDSSTQRYQVFQKLNNYTDKRLDGYKIEVLDENGSSNSALTISLGIGENPGNDGTASDIWDSESRANFSHGLWGPVDHHFDEPGFFDDRRVYYAPTLSSDNHVISYQGAVLGGNYQALFGDWLPSIWKPEGIFHDDDMNPATDGALVAFWGDPQNTGSNAWHSGKSSNWQTATEEDLLRWTGEWYQQSSIEDVLNLGLNYIVNVGDNSSIGNKFTIRITPHIASDQSQPAYVSNPPTSAPYTESEGIIVMEVQMVPDEDAVSTVPGDDPSVDAPVDAPDESDTSLVALRSKAEESGTVINQSAIITVGVADGDLNLDPAVAETVEVMVTSDHGEVEMVTLTESGPNTGRFIGTLQAEVGNTEMLDNDGKFNLNMVTNLKANYVDNQYGEQSGPQTLEASLNVDVASTPDVDDDTPDVDDDTPDVDDDTPDVDDDTPVVDDDTPDVDDDTPVVDDDTPDVDDDTPVVDDDDSVVVDDTPVVVDDAPVVVDDELVSGGNSGSTFDAQSDASFMLMLLGFLGMGGFVARRKLGTTDK